MVALTAGVLFSTATFAQQPSQIGSGTFLPDRTSEYNVKGAYIYNFARYVTWPESSHLPATAEFHIGVLGESGVIAPLQKIAKFKKIVDRRTGNSLPIKLREFANLSECQPCQILFVAESVAPDVVAAVLTQYADLPVLIVGETTGFARAKGNAEFLLVSGGVRFDLNLDATSQKQLKLDAKLLKAANSIVQTQTASSVTQN